MNDKPCREAENNSGEFWECRAWKYAECEYQQYDYNPDNTVNICKCGYEKGGETDETDD